jgi:hypothetical protein
MKDTLGDQPYQWVYPLSAGYKENTTSRGAAARINPRVANLRLKVLAEIKAAGADGLTADEACERAGISVLAGRPRTTELYKLGLIEPAGKTRRNASGQSAKVWVAK